MRFLPINIAYTLGHRKDLEKPLPGKPSIDASMAIPTTFTAAANWPHCTTIGTIYDQARFVQKVTRCAHFKGAEAAGLLVVLRLLLIVSVLPLLVNSTSLFLSLKSLSVTLMLTVVR